MAVSDLRRQLAASSDALYNSVSETCSAEQLDDWLRGFVPLDCPLCGSPSSSASTIVTKHQLNTVRFRVCAMVSSHFARDGMMLDFINPRTSTLLLEHHEAAAYRELARRKYEYYLQDAEWFSALGTPLDIGCCGGEFMEVLRGRNWSPCGIDASESFVLRARSRGFDVRLGLFPVSGMLQSSEIYRMITMLDILEHLQNPVSSLRSLRPHLLKDGILLIQVPYFHSPLVALEGAANKNYSFSHWSHFTAITLAATVNAAGFKLLNIETVITEIDLILAFTREAIESAIRLAVGDISIPAVIAPSWIHEH